MFLDPDPNWKTIWIRIGKENWIWIRQKNVRIQNTDYKDSNNIDIGQWVTYVPNGQFQDNSRLLLVM